MADIILVTCPFCGKPHKVTLSTFESAVNVPPALVGPPPTFWQAFFQSLFTSDLGLALGLAVISWLFGWLYGASPLWSVLVLVLAGFGFPLVRLFLSRPLIQVPKSDKVRVDVVIDDKTEGGFTRSIDSFNPDLVVYGDLCKLALSRGFSRSAACSVGLSQDKWHKIKAEFLRLNYVVPLPNGSNGYSLTLRGSRLLAQIRQGQQTTTNNRVRSLAKEK
jgi:hypothetical protein